MNIEEILKKSSFRLSKKSKTPHLDAEILLSYTIQKPREFILAHPEFNLNVLKIKKFEKLLKRRLKYEPIAYILDEKEFYGLNFKVTPDTLIPRPETELLVDKVLNLVHTEVRTNISTNVLTKKIAVIDIGTGSGNIIISIAKNISNCKLFGIDFSKKALTIAKYNAKENKIGNKIKFIQSDLLNCFLQTKNQKLKANKIILVANLPYVSKEIYLNTSPDIKKYEPKSALYSSKNGLAHYEKLFKQIKTLETRRHKLEVILEFSPEQRKDLKRLIEKCFPDSKLIFHKDLAKKYRFAHIKI